ncbi:beta-lactamase family protein [Streptomyces marincola]|uniref:beta-lactamase family protein n=1 Tax=Streptomyces marincola TaxID=2878388 RepID=UPI001CF42F20|nr:beta-lactamase family protein [Streptomyces marincola]UCM89813.1 beta-lactamase family protein [Streptomyces marincola]
MAPARARANPPRGGSRRRASVARGPAPGQRRETFGRPGAAGRAPGPRQVPGGPTTTTGYRRRAPRPPGPSQSLFSSAGAMVSTLGDLTAFYRALTAGEILTPASPAEMRAAHPVGEAGYGLGLTRYRELSCGGTAWGHDGLLPGYMTYTLVTDDGRHASVVTNAYFQVNTPRAQLHALLDAALCESGAARWEAAGAPAVAAAARERVPRI